MIKKFGEFINENSDNVDYFSTFEKIFRKVSTTKSNDNFTEIIDGVNVSVMNMFTDKVVSMKNTKFNVLVEIGVEIIKIHEMKMDYSILDSLIAALKSFHNDMEYDIEGNNDIITYFHNEVVGILEENFNVDIYTEKGNKCGFEIESWTDDIDCNQITFIDLRDSLCFYNVIDIHKELLTILQNYDPEDDYNSNMGDKRFSELFSSKKGKKQALADFEAWKNDYLKATEINVNKFIRPFRNLISVLDYTTMDYSE